MVAKSTIYIDLLYEWSYGIRPEMFVGLFLRESFGLSLMSSDITQYFTWANVRPKMNSENETWCSCVIFHLFPAFSWNNFPADWLLGDGGSELGWWAESWFDLCLMWVDEAGGGCGAGGGVSVTLISPRLCLRWPSWWPWVCSVMPSQFFADVSVSQTIALGNEVTLKIAVQDAEAVLITSAAFVKFRLNQRCWAHAGD